ncbi:MAG: RNA 3'-terminal phosphate cyclase [Chloroflexota bacterium]|nr:MAG: RNA 3'-terminal phosphate cyclase [Chloroflexota bacterium]
MRNIDGAIGEGGGQVLRTCLALSIVTGQDFTIRNIRSSRKKPGLRPQHLNAVKIAAIISNANVYGAQQGSTQLSFSPRSIQPGKFTCEIGTAGSTALVLQTIYLPLSLLDQPSFITISGGTHAPLSPSFDFINQHWLHYLKRIGFDIQMEMVLAGFYPQGGGKIRGNIRPVKTIEPLNIPERGSLRQIRGYSGVANLDRRIAERQRNQVIHRLGSQYPLNDIRISQLPSKFKGTTVCLICEFEHSQSCYFSLGALGKPAEKVADEVCEKIEYFLSTNAVMDEYLADQLLLPLSFANGNSNFSTSKITNHLLTNAEIIRNFMNTDISIDGSAGNPGIIKITPYNQ